MEGMTVETVESSSIVRLFAELGQVNRPPGGVRSVSSLIQSAHLDSSDTVLDVGCATGFVSLELARLADCNVVGIDLSEDMIEAARDRKRQDPAGERVSFEVADAQSLPYEDDRFDAVVCGGSTVYMDDHLDAVEEYRRVVKPWGTISEVNYFYDVEPPTEFFDELKRKLSPRLEQWDLDYWKQLYDRADLERLSTEIHDVEPVPDEHVRRYVESLAGRADATDAAHDALFDRLYEAFSVINRNFEYQQYAIFTLRKRPLEKRIEPFDQRKVE